ncbi:MAG: DinB family protein [Acidobacteria bacterium]|nr:DinB family protein [Acidobacteriota bacterium]
MPLTVRPAADEYAPFYETDVGKVPEGDLLETLRRQSSETLDLLAGLDEEAALHRYEPGKWSVKEVVGHMIDTERIFSYRALSFARKDPNPLPGMDQEPWAAAAGFDRRTLDSLLSEWRHLREANVLLFASFDDETLSRRGTASGWEVTVRALLYIVAGHELHHRRILEERYLLPPG